MYIPVGVTLRRKRLPPSNPGQPSRAGAASIRWASAVTRGSRSNISTSCETPAGQHALLDAAISTRLERGRQRRVELTTARLRVA
jgi:hypothetical protein